MRVERFLRFVVINAAAVGLGAAVASSCATVLYPTVAFRCDPSAQDDACPETHFCCSDDPAAVGGALPDYIGRNIAGGDAAIFSGDNNVLSRSGMCVNLDDIPSGAGLQEANAADCPIPCNPTWDEDDIATVCGPSRQCCQTVEIEPADCVREGSAWRPANGTDIGRADITPTTNWTSADHATNQDPGGNSCEAFAGGTRMGPVFSDCAQQLTVADQRGFCMLLEVGTLCPAAANGYRNACELINDDELPPPAGN